MTVPEPLLEGESTQENILMSRELKYTPPDMRQFTKGKLTKEMIRILCVEVDESKIGKE